LDQLSVVVSVALTKNIRVFFIPPAKFQNSNTIRTRPIPSEFFPIHHSFSIAPGTEVIKLFNLHYFVIRFS